MWCSFYKILQPKSFKRITRKKLALSQIKCINLLLKKKASTELIIAQDPTNILQATGQTLAE